MRLSLFSQVLLIGLEIITRRVCNEYRSREETGTRRAERGATRHAFLAHPRLPETVVNFTTADESLKNRMQRDAT